MENVEISPHFRAGYVTIMGEPNVGKSTLMNALVQQKISIVTSKPQTTRHKILGILSTPGYQVVFLDTPGIIIPRYRLQEAMMQSASSAVADADLLLFMIDATQPRSGEDLARGEAFTMLEGLRKPVFLIINKVDLVNKAGLLPVIDHYSRAFPFREIFPVSALRLDGIDALTNAVVMELPEHPPFYPLDIASEHNDRFFVGEIIREKVFLKYQEEIPYSTAVQVVEFKERSGGKWFISADIYVERESQKAIIIGKRGAMLKEIGQLARKEIEQFLEHPVFLELHAKVREHWRENDQSLARFGYKS
jgi:GTP-binding protein Era